MRGPFPGAVGASAISSCNRALSATRICTTAITATAPQASSRLLGLKSAATREYHGRQPSQPAKMAGITGDSQLFEDNFTVTAMDQSKYDRCGRLSGTSTDSQTLMTLDINTELFPCTEGETLHVVLATTLSLDGSKESEKGWRDATKVSGGDVANLADMFDYVCHGKIYKFEDGDDGQSLKAYISFGGLLMALTGPYKKLTPLRVDNTYLLIKK